MVKRRNKTVVTNGRTRSGGRRRGGRSAGEPDVTVRMFCQGLGDCFLITIPQDGGRPYSILIDCGVAMGTPSAESIMNQVVAKVGALTQGAVDLLVVTHQHWDHISGFVLAATELEKITFKHLWFAWTEDPKDALARELRARYAKAKVALARAFQAAANLRADATSAARLQALEGVMAFFGPGVASATAGKGGDANAAMAFPRKLVGADANPGALEYLLAGNCKALPGASGYASGVQVLVLGPPHDRAKLLRIDPRKRPGEAYEQKKGDAPGLGINWAWMASAMSDDVIGAELPGDPMEAANHDRSQPFERTWGVRLDDAETDPQFASYFADDLEHQGRRIDGDWLWSGAQRLALQMDSYTNNTCLALAFELPRSRQVLLFAADAQIGNWLSWHDQDYDTRDGRRLSASDLLVNTTLYKVGHHGSHNATLKEKGLELMTHPELVAMLPVEADGVIRLRYGQMPLKSLVAALQEKTDGRVLRLDEKWRGNTAPGTWSRNGVAARLSPEQITVGASGKTSQRALYMELALRDA